MGNEQMTTTTLWNDRQNAREFLAAVGLTNNLPLFVRFYDGDQWGRTTDATLNMPRLTTNIIKMICRNKKAAILSTPVRIVYKGENDKSAEKFTRFSDFIQKEMGQDDLDKQAVGSGVKKGTYIFHYYWDAEARGKRGQLPGGLRCELIDPLNAYFANPAEPDEQKQKWIMFESREEVQAVREKADKAINPEMITEDEQESPYPTKEQKGTPMCTVLTRYFRKNGEVYCEKATKSVVFNAAFPITPDLDRAMDIIRSAEPYADESEKKKAKEDPGNNALPDKAGEGKRTITDRTRAYLYPVVVGNYEPRENSIYGLGEVEGLIANQKSINLIMSMIAYNIEQTAWSKYVVQPGALNGQRINNDPAQVLTDWSKTGNGIKRMEGQQIPAGAFSIIDTVTSMTRTVTGSSEVMTGETAGANMSGAAIAQLQSQALLPVEELKDTFWNVKRKQGKVLAQFFKLYYTETPFVYEDEVPDKDANGAVKTDAFGNPVKKTVRVPDTFSSREYRNADMDVIVETTAGTKSSAAGDITALDLLLQHGDISAKTYIEMYPEGALSNKTELVEKLGEMEANALQSMQQQMIQAQQQIAQQQQIIQEQNDTINKVNDLLNENKRLQEMLLEMHAEASDKLRDANEQIEKGNRLNAEVTADAEAMAADLARIGGIA